MDCQDTDTKWYVLRVTYQRELSTKEYLDKLHVENFVPVRVVRRRDSKGRFSRVREAAVHNYIFVRSTREVIDDLKTFRLPILRVKRTCISAQTAEALGDSLEKNTLYGQRAAMRPGGLAESEASHFTAYVQNLWTSAADEAAIFAPNQEKSLRDAEDFLARQTETLLGEQQIGCLPYRAGLRSERLVRDGAKKGGYYIEAWETLRGIPVVTGVERTFSRQSGRAVQQALSNTSWIVLGEYRSDADYIWMATAMWREIGEVQPDVPLCGWAQVERTLTDWIERGRIRNVYSVTLGYAAYAAPDRKYPDDETAYEAEYWLAPTWCVECKYAESAARALTADGAEEDETEARGYQHLRG